MGLEVSEQAQDEWLQKMAGVCIQVSLTFYLLTPLETEADDAEQEKVQTLSTIGLK